MMVQEHTMPDNVGLFADRLGNALVAVSDAVERFYPDVAVAMSWGKDSVAVLGLVRQLYPDFAVKVLFTDTGRKFPETYQHAKLVEYELGPVEVLTYSPDGPLQDCDTCRAWKVTAAVAAPKEFGIECLLVGIRGDEHEARASAGSGRLVDGVTRVHPIISWTERDVWDYTHLRGLPVHPLYAQGYRSLGCMDPCTVRTPDGLPERAGRAQDKEAVMGTLRGQGYW